MMGTDGIRQALLNENIVPVEDEPDVFVMGIDRTLDYMALARATVLSSKERPLLPRIKILNSQQNTGSYQAMVLLLA